MISFEAVLLLLFCLAGGMWHSHRVGLKNGRLEGINASLDHLIEEGRIDVLDAAEAEDAI